MAFSRLAHPRVTQAVSPHVQNGNNFYEKNYTMNVNPEMQFIKWLAKLLEYYRSLTDNMERMQDDDIKKRLDELTSFLLQLEEHCKRHAVNLLDYKHEILELHRYHERVVEYVKNRPHGLFGRFFEIAARVFDELLKLAHLPPVANLIREAVETYFLPSPSPTPLLPSPVYDEEPKKEVVKETIPSPITHPTPRSTPSPTQNTRPPEPQKDHSSEETPVYAKFLIAKTSLFTDHIRNNAKGVLIDVDMQFKDLLNIKCKVQLSFWFADGRPIMDRYERDLVKLETSITPDSRYYEKNVRFFMPNSKLGLGGLDAGVYRKVKYKVRMNATKEDSGQIIGNKEEVIFEILDTSSKI